MIFTNMTKNIGEIDKIIRFLFAIMIGVALYFHLVTGITAFLLGIVALVMVGTTVSGVCPLYFLLGFSTYNR